MEFVDILFLLSLLLLYFLPKKSENYKYYWIIPLLILLINFGIRIYLINQKHYKAVTISNQETEIAKLEAKASEAQKALSELQERLKHRQLTGDQRRKMISILSPFAGASIEVQRRGELEAYKYANQLIEVLKAAGLNVEVSGGLGGSSAPQYGIIWWTKDENAKITEAMEAALEVTGIPNSPNFVRDLSTDAAIRVGLKIE